MPLSINALYKLYFPLSQQQIEIKRNLVKIPEMLLPTSKYALETFSRIHMAQKALYWKPEAILLFITEQGL
jgi:hypothetical protein